MRGPRSDNGVTVYCLGDVPCPCRLQEARSSPEGGLGERAGLLGGVSWGWVCEQFVHRAWSLRGSAGESWPGCSREPWGMSPLVLVPHFGVSLGAALIPLTHPFVFPT